MMIMLYLLSIVSTAFIVWLCCGYLSKGDYSVTVGESLITLIISLIPGVNLIAIVLIVIVTTIEYYERKYGNLSNHWDNLMHRKLW